MKPTYTTSVNITANTLFHMTKKKTSLCGILKEGFIITYCFEQLSVYGQSSMFVGAPMVCFCDLPLFLIRNHLKVYGHYGIGLTKEWGKRSQVSPVAYVHEHSSLLQVGKTLESGSFKFNDNFGTEIDENIFKIFKEHMSSLKSYEGKVWDKDTKHFSEHPKRFYDEREWRYVPPEPELYIGNTGELEWKILIEVEERVQTDGKLKFDAQDVEYIMVPKENQLLGMRRAIGRIERFTEKERATLTTKLISAEKILRNN